jgi:hypothetical protein
MENAEELARPARLLYTGLAPDANTARFRKPR